MLRRLGLELARSLDVGHVGNVDVEDVAPPDVVPELPDCLQKRQALDVAYRPPYLGDDDILVLPQAPDPVLYLVGYVRDDLHGSTEVVPPPLAAYDLPVHAPRRDVGELAQVLVEETLVVAEIQVRLGPILGDKDLAVLVRVHGPGIHVYVRVEFLQHYPVAPRLEEHPERRGTGPLADGRHDAARNEDILGLNHRAPNGRTSVMLLPPLLQGIWTRTRPRW